MAERRDSTVLFALITLLLTVGSLLFSYYALNIGTWSWLIGGLVMTLCLLAYIYINRRAGREVVARVRATDDEGFRKKERVFNRTVSRPAAGPLWKSRTYGLSRGDMLKVEVVADHEVTTRLVKIGPGSIREDVDSSNGPVKRWSKRIEIREDGDHQVVLDSAHPKVTVTVKIGHRPDGSK